MSRRPWRARAARLWTSIRPECALAIARRRGGCRVLAYLLFLCSVRGRAFLVIHWVWGEDGGVPPIRPLKPSEILGIDDNSSWEGLYCEWYRCMWTQAGFYQSPASINDLEGTQRSSLPASVKPANYPPVGSRPRLDIKIPPEEALGTHRASYSTNYRY